MKIVVNLRGRLRSGDGIDIKTADAATLMSVDSAAISTTLLGNPEFVSSLIAQIVADADFTTAMTTLVVDTVNAGAVDDHITSVAVPLIEDYLASIPTEEIETCDGSITVLTPPF